MNQMPPLDDLLPSNDGSYCPPANLADLFESDSPLFELADVYKYDLSRFTAQERRAFVMGWEANHFDVFLKTGKPFFTFIEQDNVERLTARAKMFGRNVSSSTAGVQWIIRVSGHEEK